MINANHEELTADAVAVMDRTSDPRLREIMVSLVRHLHAFVRDVRLTESEFREATAILKETDQPELARKLLKHVVSKEAGHILSLEDATCNVVTNKAVEELYTPEEKDILQMDYMWHAWDNSQMHRIAPNIDDMLQIWQEELSASQ